MIAASLVLLSCAPKEAVRPEEAIVPHREGAVNEAVLLNSIAFRGMRTIKSEVRMRAERGGEGLGTLDGVFAFVDDGRMGIRLFGPLGMTAMEVTINAGVMQIYIPSKDIIYEGGMPGGAGLRLVPDAGDDAGSAVMEELDGEYALYITGKDAAPARPKRAYTFDKISLLNTSVTFFTDGQPAMSVDFGEYQSVPPPAAPVSTADSRPMPRIPMNMKIYFPQGHMMEIRLKNPVLDESVPDAFFSLRPHDGKEVKPLDSLFKKTDADIPL